MSQYSSVQSSQPAPYQMGGSEKNIQYSDEFSYDKVKNSSTNYTSYSGNGSFYNQQQSDISSNHSEMNDEISVNSSTSVSQFIQDLPGNPGKKIKIVMKKPTVPKPSPNDPHEIQKQQLLQQAKQQQLQQQQQQQLLNSNSVNNMKHSRQMNEQDKQLIQMLKK